ncbi:exopolyphosphatase PRUNE1 [Sphaerodactylus townsendi]|uniref:exopolyphosphatase PRUNE1 n=1 Tax=Sphaerodactylus townsendi TaxID=933632 RepID=UPI0020275724|nr:exopolyphosphatase PRUNE1 [Sphaerodactylus townsendi]
MELFLGGCRAALQTCLRSHCKLHVVLGNEACDLDSMVSALALAYFFAKTAPEKRAAFIPVLNIPRSDFPLRTESTFLLKEHRIPESAIIFRDEIDLLDLHRAGLLSLTLVDHHVLPSQDTALEEAVVEVVDHRPLEWERSPHCRVTSELVGSCATLVTEKILQGPMEVLDQTTAALLHGTIVLDCVNMAPEAGKVTPKDMHFASLLESKFPDLPPRGVVFEALQNAKLDVSGLTTDQMLRKDLKAISGKEIAVALSSVYVTLQDFLCRLDVEQDLSTFCQQRGYDALVLMAISFHGRNEPFRQLAVYSQQEALRTGVCQSLEDSSNPSLNLSLLESPHPTIRAYAQGNTAASRKKVLPIVKDFLREWGHRATMQPCRKTRAEPTDSSSGSTDSRPPEKGAAGRKEPAKSQRLGDDLLGDEDTHLPPTPMNSLVDECPLNQGLPKLSAEAVFEKFNHIAVAHSCEDSPEKK